MTVKQILVLGALAVVTSSLLQAGEDSIRIGTERQVPTGWSKPEVTTDEGRISIKPSMPEDYQMVTTGAAMAPSSSVHEPGAETIPRKTGKFKVRLRDNTVLILSPGDTFQAKGETYKLLGLINDKIHIRAMTSGRILTLGKR